MRSRVPSVLLTLQTLLRAGPKTGSATQEVSPPAKFRQKLSEGVAVVGLAPQRLSSSQNAGWVLGCALIAQLFLVGCGTEALARRGLLDAGRVDWQQGSVSLDGEWEFYWNELLTPGDLAGRTATDTIRVPGMWNDHVGPMGMATGEGVATYRLLVTGLPAGERDDRRQGPAGDQSLALRVPTMHTAYRLFANGREIASNGRVGTSRETSQPQYHPLIVTVPNAHGSLELVLQISNFHHRKGGTWTGIRIGRADAVRSEQSARVVLDLLLVGALLVLAFYHFLLYSFRRRDRSPLFLGLFFLLVVMRILTTGEHYLALWVPGLPWEVYVKVQYLSFYLAAIAWGFLMRRLFPLEWRPAFQHVLSWPVALGSVIVVLTPVRVFSFTMSLIESYAVLSGLVISGVLVVVLVRRREGAVFFLVGWLALFLAMLNDILVNSETIHGALFLHVGVFLFALMQSAILSQRFSHAFAVAEQTTGMLEQTVAHRTSELRQSRDALSLALGRAEEASRVKSDFLSAVSHEIRTPLNAILGMSAVLEQGALDDDQRRQVETLNRAGRKLLRLVSDVLDLARIEAGKQILHEAVFDPVALCRDLLSIFEETARERGIDLVFACGDDTPRSVVADPGRIEQVLLNLVANAMKFTDRGSIGIRLDRSTGAKGEEILSFSVSDTGTGIPPDRIETIFDRFVQVDQTASRRHEGSGLGLAICKGIVDWMGGSIHAESEPGRGSRFWFSVPVRLPGMIPAAGADDGEGEGDARSLPNRLRAEARILVVEDNEDNRYLMELYLAKTGATVQFATDGAAAVQAASSCRHDVILMDVQMPGMDGYEATRRIRAEETERGQTPVPIIALTADATIEAMRASASAGCNEHLTKPVSRARLLEVVARYAGE